MQKDAGYIGIAAYTVRSVNSSRYRMVNWLFPGSELHNSDDVFILQLGYCAHVAWYICALVNLLEVMEALLCGYGCMLVNLLEGV